MIDPFVFDQYNDDEEAIDSALEKARKRRKKIQAVLTVLAITKFIGGEFLNEENDKEYFSQD